MQNQNTKSKRSILRRVITSAYLFMITGTLLELYLLEHYKGKLRLIPILCISAVIVSMLILFFRKTRLTVICFKIILVITAFSGIYGTFLHLRANYEFEQEMRPTDSNWNLLLESFSGAMPALAPLSLIVLALMGYSYLILINQKQ